MGTKVKSKRTGEQEEKWSFSSQSKRHRKRKLAQKRTGRRRGRRKQEWVHRPSAVAKEGCGVPSRSSRQVHQLRLLPLCRALEESGRRLDSFSKMQPQPQRAKVAHRRENDIVPVLCSGFQALQERTACAVTEQNLFEPATGQGKLTEALE